MRVGKLGFWAIILLLSLLAAQSALAQSTPLPRGSYAENVEFVAFTDVGGHIPFKMDIQQANGHWYLYTGAQFDRGWAVLDITDPAKPSMVNWIPGPKNTRTVQLDIADGKMITGLEKSQGGGDTDFNAPFDEGVLIWSLADPVHPKLLGQYKTGGLGTHRDGYYGGRYMHLASGARGYSGNIYQIVDIGDPAHPELVSQWALPELKLADPNAQNTAFPHGHGLHGPPVPVGNLVYLPFGTKMVILDISDVKNPKVVSEMQFDPPFHLGFAVHTVLPFPERKIVETNSENFGGRCSEGPSQVSLVDVSDPAKPQLLSFFPAPLPPPGAPFRDFCEKGGTFGAHNVNMLFHNPSLDHSDNILYLTYTNAGLRIYDIADARQPREIGYFIPPDADRQPDPARRNDPKAPQRVASAAADVVVDTRGYIYLSDRSQGIWVLRYTGPKPGPALPVHPPGASNAPQHE